MERGSSYNKQELLSFFDRLLPQYSAAMEKVFSDEAANRALSAARDKFDDLIQDIPYIGPLSFPLPSTLVESAVSLSFYMVWKESGVRLEAAGSMILEAVREGLGKQSPEELRKEGAGMFTEEFYKIQTFVADESHKKHFPGDWIFDFVKGKPGENYDWGWDFTECAILKFFRAHDALELLPFMCIQDFIISELQGTGLERTTTLYDGDVCDFRFKKAGQLMQCAGVEGQNRITKIL